jgi:YVTN family beta-propeller protein
VALAGTGGNVGNGTKLVEVTLSPPPRGITGTVKVGVYPDAVAVAPGGHLVLVANYSSNTVTPIVVPGNHVLPAINAGEGPAAIAITPNGATAYVTDANSDTVTPIDLRTMKPKRPIVVGNGPQGIAITPDGAKAYVADAGAIVTGQAGPIGDDVTPINLRTGKAGAPIKVGNAPVGVAVSSDGSTVFVTNLNSESVSPISVASDTVGSSIATDGAPIAVIVADNSAWVINTSVGGSQNNVQPISFGGFAGVPVKLPKGAQNITVAPGGKTAWIVCLNADKIVLLNLGTHKVGSAITVKGGPFAIAVAYQPRTPAPTTTTTTVAKKKKTTTTTKAKTTKTTG